ncbi:HAD family hydrolase [Saccharothrix coeruleofusca]|uniref:Hydrolase n=1 Tax=Saccharothrix coeruleofusca TaxID=33919 RepID=A0A918AK41_9PSEU|nr:HAD hydrolase-like protein [Saccharothrix coeruleofusca]GGP39336.1 hydrolase [Saccharothrix coeruleofusca]
MTTNHVPVDQPDPLHALLTSTDTLLLDFDGPICSVFAGMSAQRATDQLRTILKAIGYSDMPPKLLQTEDPFEVLHYAATLGAEQAEHIEVALRAWEVEAITTAVPTPGAHILMRVWHETGGKLAVVSNNSDSAVRAYLDHWNLHTLVDVVSARTKADPSVLKPAHFLVTQALNTLEMQPDKAVMLGDSVSDILAAKRSGVRSIGYANKNGKVALLAKGKPDYITTTITNITHALVYDDRS